MHLPTQIMTLIAIKLLYYAAHFAALLSFERRLAIYFSRQSSFALYSLLSLFLVTCSSTTMQYQLLLAFVLISCSFAVADVPQEQIAGKTRNTVMLVRM